MTTTPQPSAHPWWSTHLHYHEDLDVLLRSVVAPVAAELDASGTPWFHLRYWDGGSHVRLRIHAESEGARLRVADLVDSAMADLVRDRPSTGGMSQEEYAQVAVYLAGRERTSHHAALLEDNRAHETPYVREHDRYGTGASMTAVEDHFVESSRLALAAVVGGAGPDSVGFETMVATFDVLRRADRLGPAGLRAAREAWSDPTGPPALSAAGLEQRYQAQRAPLLAAARRQVEGAAGPAHVAAWRGSVTRLLDRLVDAGVAGPERVVDLCLHLFCNRVGVAMPSEIYLRHLATRAMEEAS